MTGIDVSASFGIDIAELDAYGRADPPRPARGSLGRRAKDRAAKSCRLRSQAGICDPCIDAPGFGKLGNSLSEGFNDKAKTLKKAVRPIKLRAPQEADIPHLRQKRPQEMKEIPKTNRPQEKLENPKI